MVGEYGRLAAIGYLVFVCLFVYGDCSINHLGYHSNVCYWLLTSLLYTLLFIMKIETHVMLCLRVPRSGKLTKAEAWV
jgi:hypothetical protein